MLGAEDRLVIQDISEIIGNPAAAMLWHAANCCDFIDHKILKHECGHLKYGKKKIANAILVHAAPQLFKIGKCRQRNHKDGSRNFGG